MKKKILLITTIVAMLAIMVGGTLAYFTAEDAATNTFTIGSVKIEIYENNKATDSDTMSFGMLTPIVNTTSPGEDVSYIKKAVNVKNTGNNSAYIRVHIAVPQQLANGYLCLDLNTTGWENVSDANAVVEIGEEKYVLFTYDYMNAVDPTLPTDLLLKGVYLANDVDLQENAAGNLEFIRRVNGAVVDQSGFVAHTKNGNGGYTSANVNVLIAAQAIQAAGFDNYSTALANFTTHPWAN